MRAREILHSSSDHVPKARVPVEIDDVIDGTA